MDEELLSADPLTPDELERYNRILFLLSEADLDRDSAIAVLLVRVERLERYVEQLAIG